MKNVIFRPNFRWKEVAKVSHRVESLRLGLVAFELLAKALYNDLQVLTEAPVKLSMELHVVALANKCVRILHVFHQENDITVACELPKRLETKQEGQSKHLREVLDDQTTTEISGQVQWKCELHCKQISNQGS